MKKPKILVVGSCNMDEIAATSVMPREGQTVLGNEFSKAPGGKGANQAVQAARLGAEVTMIGKLGLDSNGDELLEVLKDSGIDVSHILRDGHTATGCAIIILEQKNGEASKNRIIVLPGTNAKITKDDVAFLKDTIDSYDFVILQNEIPMEINEFVARYAFEKGVPVMLNPAPSAPLSANLLSHLTYISPNEHEASDLTGINIEHNGSDFNKEQVKEASEVLRQKGVKNVLITLGNAGAVLVNDEGFFYSPALNQIKAVDPTAAGDSFVATFCTGVACGWKCQEILEFANCVASITVSKKGAMPSLPTLNQVVEFNKKNGFNVPDLSNLMCGKQGTDFEK